MGLADYLRTVRMIDLKFTLENIRKLKPKDRDYFRWDPKVSGLGVRVHPTGKKVFVLELRFVPTETGVKKERLHTIGDIDDFESIEEVRRVALSLRRRYKRGEDVLKTKRRRLVEDTTLRQWLESWLEDRSATGHHKPSTARDVRQAAAGGWYDWLDRPLRVITPEAALKRHAARSRVAPTRANTEMRYLRALWRWVALRNPDLSLGPPPTNLINEARDWNPTRRKTRRIAMTDLPAWVAAIRELANRRAGLLFELLLYTGLRGGETRELQWRHVDLTCGTVHLPDPKNKIATTLPLSTQALDALLRLFDETGRSQLCFPAMSRAGVEIAMPRPNMAVRAVKDATGIDWSPHDLRRGFLSIGGALRLHPTVLRVLTNHAVASADAHSGYFVPSADELREAAQAIGDRIDAQVSGAKVINLPKRRATP